MDGTIAGIILVIGMQLGASIFAFGKLFERVKTNSERINRIEKNIFESRLGVKL